MKALMKAERERIKEQQHQIHIIFPSTVIILWQMGWREQQIKERLNESIGAMKCGYQTGMSVFEVLENETGIEMTLEGEKSYHEFAYLSADTQVKPLNEWQETYMIQRMTRWIPSLMLAGICLALHRTDGWEYDELADFIGKMNELRMELGEDETRYADRMFEVTGHYEKELWLDEEK